MLIISFHKSVGFTNFNINKSVAVYLFAWEQWEYLGVTEVDARQEQ